MVKYYLRLDDACEFMDLEKWTRMEQILDKFSINPLVGIIPFCNDDDLIKYENNTCFWDTALNWQAKGWVIALHGYAHQIKTSSGGINPVNKRSEFAGLDFEQQRDQISKGYERLISKSLEPKVFFSPFHTFDKVTLRALKEKTDVVVVSDTIARKRYNFDGITFIPQQSGKVRKLPFFKEITFCYHPNKMTETDFIDLESFIEKNRNKFHSFDISEAKRGKSLFDKILSWLYFTRRK